MVNTCALLYISTGIFIGLLQSEENPPFFVLNVFFFFGSHAFSPFKTEVLEITSFWEQEVESDAVTSA